MSEVTRFANPVLSGHHPDPSACAVGGDFYLVTSSFAYMPGIPVFHSRDLVDWRLIGHVLTRPSQFDLLGFDTSDGVWAPTIRHHDGLFYVVVSMARDRRDWTTYVSTATDAAGPWSDFVELDAEGFDPSLFFDDDGRCWFTAVRNADPASGVRADLWMRELDLEKLELVGPLHVLWHGAMRGEWVEAPHVYRRDGVYHLIAAEGGTEGNHSVVAARASSVTGPYEPDPRNPLLTHRHLLRSHPIQSVGHADLVDTPAGETWAIVLATRPIDGTHTLGRETFLVGVEWTPEGPVFAPGSGFVEPHPERPSLWGATGAPRPVEVDPWVGLRAPLGDRATFDGPDRIVLATSPDELGGRGTPAFAARPQQHVDFELSARVEFAPRTREDRAGLVAFQGQDRFVAFGIEAEGEEGVAVVLRGHAANDAVIGRTTVRGAPILRIIGTEVAYRFEVVDETDAVVVGEVPRSWLSTEEAGGFVGVHLGPFATGAPGASAEFSALHYRPTARTGD